MLLLDEALALQAKYGVYKSFPLRATVFGMKALLSYRAGAAGIHGTLDNATAAFQAAKYVQKRMHSFVLVSCATYSSPYLHLFFAFRLICRADPLSTLCFPCVFALSRLMPLSRKAVCMSQLLVINTPELIAKASKLGLAGALTLTFFCVACLTFAHLSPVLRLQPLKWFASQKAAWLKAIDSKPRGWTSRHMQLPWFRKAVPRAPMAAFPLVLLCCAFPLRRSLARRCWQTCNEEQQRLNNPPQRWLLKRCTQTHRLSHALMMLSMARHAQSLIRL